MNDEKIIGTRVKSRLGNDAFLSTHELADIYDRYSMPIYRFIFRQVGNVETSRELTSEVFHRMVKINQNGGSEHVQRMEPWLYSVARNLVIDHYRRQKFRNHLPLNDDLLESSSNTVKNAEIQITMEKIRSAIQKLSPDQRQVILLKFVEGISNHEVANTLSKPVGAVKSLQHRALVALRQLLESYE